MNCGIISLKEQISAGVEKGLATLCPPSVKKTALVVVSLFAALTSGALALLSASVLFSGPTSVLPYILMLTTALFGLVCAIIVLVKNASEVIQKCKKASVKEPEPKQPHDRLSLEIGASGRSSPTSSIEVLRSMEDDICNAAQSSPTSGIEGVLRSIGDDICSALDKKDVRPRSHSC